MTAGTLSRLYTGEGGIDFVGRSKLWYGITAVLLAASVALIALRGFSLGIDFEGGTKMNMPDANYSIEQVEEAFVDATGITPELVQVVGAGDSRMVEINSERLTEEQIDNARVALFEKFQPTDQTGEATPDAIGDSTVSESWGSTITNRMLMAMAVFLILTFVYIAIRFERDMSIAAMSALLVDLVLISGIYSLVGFEVTPATIIGLLTVLAFSLYDTVVVFDKVKENTAGFEASRRRTYAEQANLAVNQTVMRSISTTVISALPIIALMVVAVWLMGVGTLKDLALVQLIGVIEGTLSSVFLATPILVSLKRRQKKMQEHEQSVLDLRAGKTPEETPVTRTVTPVADNIPQGFRDTMGNGKTWRPGQ
ncbi:protein translocase subunit SecF [Corynebacterium hindlerae]|uniref:protein translocase subunit SecF n=1 Tax=Corynebacterium hindlerae TaxID=699041 RepID=UPI0031B6E626